MKRSVCLSVLCALLLSLLWGCGGREAVPAGTCTVSVECGSVLTDLTRLGEEKHALIPADGVLLPERSVEFYEGESVFDVLRRVCREAGVHLESSHAPLYDSAYVEGIGNLYEFDCGSLSGWMYRVNGSYPNYGCSNCILSDGDRVEWRYTCDLGRDIGGRNQW